MATTCANVIDPEIIDVLRDVLGGEFPALIDTFLGDATVRICDLKDCASRGSLAALEGPAHTLKGSSANVGAFTLAQACQDLVRQCREGSLADPIAAIGAIEHELSRVSVALLGMRKEADGSSVGAQDS